MILFEKKLYLCSRKAAGTGCASAIGTSSIAFGLHRPCGVNAAKAIRQEAWCKRCSPFAISVNIIIDKYERLYNYGNSNKSNPHIERQGGT